MKNLLKSFRAGKAAKVMFLSLALTGAMSVLNAQVKDPDKNKCYWNTESCPSGQTGCLCE